MIDKTHLPNDAAILQFLGKKASSNWLTIKQFIEASYEPMIETRFWGVNNGWTIRFRKGGRTLCSLFPEQGAFSVLIVLGKKESNRILSGSLELSPRIHKIIQDTKQLHDGRWVWIRVLSVLDLIDIQKILQVKRKPKEQTSS
jgi:hypothetical protein